MLYFLPTPIGNLGDISARALNILQNSEHIICEDTRVAKSLLEQLAKRYEIDFGSKNFTCLNSHNAEKVLATLNLASLQNAVYLSDAGMPCISDPGSALIRFAQASSLAYSVLPGASASLCALAASGFSDKEFLFYGFLNIKKQRLAQLESLLAQPFAVVLYESPSRVLSLVCDIAKLDAAREIFAIKEISKMHEKYYKLRASELANTLKSANLKGEWVVVISPSSQQPSGGISSADICELDIPNRAKAKLLSKLNGKSVKQNYEELQLK